MTKKDKSRPDSGVSPDSGAKVPEVMAFELKDRRTAVGGYLDEAIQRVWRNCLYPETVTFSQYYQMYARNNVAARVIETFPDYSWSTIPFATDALGAASRFSKAVTRLLSEQYKMQDGVRQSLLTTMKQLDVLGGIGGESLLVFGFEDGLN